jgi:serine/threonine protein kinase, bacterial
LSDQSKPFASLVVLTLLNPQQSTPIRQWRFFQESKIRIGRALDNQIVLPDRQVSRYHLELLQLETPTLDGQVCRIWQVKNHSTNGTFLSGAQISQSLLPADCWLELARGGPRLRFQLLATPDEASTPSPQLPKLQRQSSAQASQPRSSSPLRSSRPCSHPGNDPENLFCIHCGQPVRVEKVVRRYQVLRVLGKGGMGTTYLTWNPPAIAPGKGKLQVLKEMNAEMAQISKAQELFEREAGILKALNHPGIPQFYDFFVEDGKKYLVMELVHGQDLERWVQEQGAISPPQAIAWMIQTCEVLTYLHSHPVPIIHRDIKPSNLLVQALTHRVVVLDFGAVKAAGVHSGTRIGAEGYSAPEQTRGRPAPQSDLYAIGTTLTFLLTGENPQHLYKRTAKEYRLVAHHPAIAPRLRQVIERATAPRPLDRYRTAQELMQALTNCLGAS